LHLSNNWSVLEKLTLDIFILNSNTVVIDLVDSVFKSAFVCFEMINFTLGLLSNVIMAICGDKTFLFTPLKNLVDISTFTALLVLITIDDLLD
jgi:hypothetical protein